VVPLDSENNFTVALCLKEIVSRDLLVQVVYIDIDVIIKVYFLPYTEIIF
jgi:hypothetical protein